MGRTVRASAVAVALSSCVGLAALAGAPEAAAQDYRSNSVGGAGGAAFTLRCAPGDYLVGLGTRSGDWVDAVAPLCARWDVSRQVFLDPGRGDMQGGRGGAVSELVCDHRSALASLQIEVAPTRLRNVAMLAARCRSVTNLRPTGWSSFGSTVAERNARAQGGEASFRVEPSLSGAAQCREDDFAVGIYGAAGDYLDRIGLICAPRPRTSEQPARRLPSLGDLASTGGDGEKSSPAPSRRQAAAGANLRVTPEAAPPAAPVAAPVAAPAAPTCRTGFVWREARAGDVVCVTPESRTLVRQENAAAASRVNPGGAYGPHTCIAGFVWREAFDGDVVCVTPERRSNVRDENRTAPSRTN